ncbi:MAG: hypothetical protein QM802_01165 [Agriterribacter sp.]
MKKYRLIKVCLLSMFLLFGTVNCKKVKEDLAMKYITSIMTDGRWIVDEFTDNNVDIAPEFIGYEFQFVSDGKVQAYYNGSQTQGTWEGNVSDTTIYSNFPSATEPLIRLNDTWKFINSTTRSVEVAPFNTGRTAYLKLVKKS